MKKFLSLLLIFSFLFVYVGSAFAEAPISTTEAQPITSPTVISAESRIRGLALKAKEAREIGSTMGIIVGLLGVAVGAMVAAEPTYTFDLNPPYTETRVDNTAGAIVIIALSAVLIVSSVMAKDSLSPMELSYQEISSMESVTAEQKQKRETLAATYLKKYADEASSARVSGGILGILVGAALLSNSKYPENTLGGALYCLLGIGDFFGRTEVEREYEEYSKSIGMTKISLEPVPDAL